MKGRYPVLFEKVHGAMQVRHGWVSVFALGAATDAALSAAISIRPEAKQKPHSRGS